MRLSQIQNELTKYSKCSQFLVYNEFLNKIVSKNFIYKNETIIPICIRQEFLSHIILCLVKNTHIIIFDPSANYYKYNFLYDYLLKLTHRKEVLKDNTIIGVKKFDCSKACIEYVIYMINNGH